MRRRIIAATTIAGLTLIAWLAMASSAAAQKGILGTGVPTEQGLVSPDGSNRYVTATVGSRTLVGKIATDGGRIARARAFNGRYAIPAVADDGSAAGLSADGSRLILAQQGIVYPRERSRFLVVEPNRIRPLETIVLDGTFTFDAISPDGRTVYLIEYIDPTDINRYQVRAYDLRRGRLVAEPLIDPEAAQATMAGAPVTRETSPDGRWAYTIYDPLNRTRPPFIHALDTETGTAACIDLDQGYVDQRRAQQLKLEPSADGASLAVVQRGTPVAVVDTESFEVSEPPVDPDPSAAGAEADGPGAARWLALGLAALVFATVGGVIIRRRRRSRAVDPDELERLVGAERDGPGSEAEDETGERAEECERVP